MFKFNIGAIFVLAFLVSFATSLKSEGEKCTAKDGCLPPMVCMSSSMTCVCPNTLQSYDPDTKTCRSNLNQPCKLSANPPDCKAGFICIGNPTPGAGMGKCLVPDGGGCSKNEECIPNSICKAKACACDDSKGMVYEAGAKECRVGQGQPCNPQSSKCSNGLSCITVAGKPKPECGTPAPVTKVETSTSKNPSPTASTTHGHGTKHKDGHGHDLEDTSAGGRMFFFIFLGIISGFILIAIIAFCIRKHVKRRRERRAILHQHHGGHAEAPVVHEGHEEHHDHHTDPAPPPSEADSESVSKSKSKPKSLHPPPAPPSEAESEPKSKPKSKSAPHQ